MINTNQSSVEMSGSSIPAVIDIVLRDCRRTYAMIGMTTFANRFAINIIIITAIITIRTIADVFH